MSLYMTNWILIFSSARPAFDRARVSSKKFVFPLYHSQCSILIFNYMLVLLERQIDEAWGPLKSTAVFEIEEQWMEN